MCVEGMDALAFLLHRGGRFEELTTLAHDLLGQFTQALHLLPLLVRRVLLGQC